MDKLDLDEIEDNSGSQRLEDNQLDIKIPMMALFERFGVGKTNVDEHRKEILKTCLGVLQNSSKIANKIVLHQCEGINVGHVITINEQVIINAATNELVADGRKDYKNCFPMMDRMHWLAQPSVGEITYLKRPAHYVII